MWRMAAVAGLCCGLALLPGCGHTPAPATPAPHAAPGADRVTGAVDSIPGKSLQAQHGEDIAELLQRRVPGLQVVRGQNGDISLRIRGGDYSLRAGDDGSIQATQDGEPLLVIDGMPVQEGQLSGALRSLHPHDVESIKVLKDVSSTAFYGIRGAHGVILITTKRD